MLANLAVLSGSFVTFSSLIYPFIVPNVLKIQLGMAPV